LAAANLDEFKYPKRVKLASEHLLVSRQGIARFLIQGHHAPFDVEEHVPLIVHPHTSEELMRLHKLFIEVWSFADRPDFVLPTKEEIVNRLIKECGFSGNRAKYGAVPIMEAEMEVDPRTRKKKFVAALMKKIIICSNEHWAPTLDQPAPRPSSEVIVRWLEKECSILPHEGKVLASIIRPSSAPLGRRPIKSK
jgi:hypothetical protein